MGFWEIIAVTALGIVVAGLVSWLFLDLSKEVTDTHATAQVFKGLADENGNCIQCGKPENHPTCCFSGTTGGISPFVKTDWSPGKIVPVTYDNDIQWLQKGFDSNIVQQQNQYDTQYDPDGILGSISYSVTGKFNKSLEIDTHAVKPITIKSKSMPVGRMFREEA